ncbi:MAG: hypothetical protein AB7O49_14920 [Sphingomonadales bacterium]
MTQFTRRELYDLVWARPMTKVAADLGISDVALGKICIRHRIPVPGRGYWAKVAVGKSVRKSLFRELNDTSVEHVNITASPARSLPPKVREAQEFVRESIRGSARTTEQLPREAAGPHPLAASLLEKLRGAKPDLHGIVSIRGKRLVPLSIAPSSANRVAGLLSELVFAAEAAGFSLAGGDGGLELEIEGERISLAVNETMDSRPHVPTGDEAEKLRRWEKQCELKRKRGQWVSDWDRPKIPDRDYFPSGRLVLEIDRGARWDGLRRRYADGKRQRLEKMIGEVLAGAAACAAAIKSRREASEQREREWRAAEERRREQERRLLLERKRMEFLVRQMTLMEEARRIEAFLADYMETFGAGAVPPDCELFLEWARRRAAATKAEAAPEMLERMLAETRLMDDAAVVNSWLRFD